MEYGWLWLLATKYTAHSLRLSPLRVWHVILHTHKSPLTHLGSDPAQEDVSFFLLLEFDPNQLFLFRQGDLDEPLARVFDLGVVGQLMFLLQWV